MTRSRSGYGRRPASGSARCWRSTRSRPARVAGWTPMVMAAVALVAVARLEGGTQTFFARLSPAVEAIQQMRASYVYVSTWPWKDIAHHLLVFAVLAAAFARVRRTMG